VVAVGLVAGNAAGFRAAMAEKTPPAPRGLVPAGGSWFCFSGHARYNPRDRASECFRREEDCQEAQALQAEDEEAVVEECRYQAKAALITYFDVMQDAWRAWAMASTSDCKDMSRILKGRDVRALSPCRLVGITEGVRLQLQVGWVPGGASWYCPVGSAGGECHRGQEKCEGALEAGGTCRAQRIAFVVAWRDEGDVAAGTVAAFANAAACKAARTDLLQPGVEVSDCRPIKDLPRPPMPAGDVPAGVGWSCYSAEDSASLDGTCARTSDACLSRRKSDVDAQRAVSDCAPRARAFGVHLPSRGVAVFPTLALCEAEAKTDDEASRCEALP
jgi:hypothetical protein